MRKLCMIFATVVFAVVCMSVSVFAANTCAHCGNSADGIICLPCGQIQEDCTCCLHQNVCDFYLNEDGSLNHLVCLECGVECGYDSGWSASDVFGLIESRLPVDPSFSIYRGPYVYSFGGCPHTEDGSLNECLYFYVDKYGLLSLVCSECQSFLSISYMYAISESFDLNYLHEFCMEFGVDLFDTFGWHIDSYSGFITTRCDCGWIDDMIINMGLVRYNGCHEKVCADCGQVYIGFIGLALPDEYVCTGSDCDFCFRQKIEGDYVPPSDSKTFTDYVTDTGSILSSGLDMASTTAKTVTENPVLLLLYAIPFTAIAAIVFRKVKR